jgi:hypothetical protein
MGALLVYFVFGSIVAVPYLGYQLLRTQRDLNQLRAELQRRGVLGGPPRVGPELEAARATVSPVVAAAAAPAALPPAVPSAQLGRVDGLEAARAEQDRS